MISIAELLLNPFFTWWLGLAVGLVVALNVWIWRYAVGYRAGVKYALDAIKQVENEGMLSPLRHHVSEEMRQAMKAAQEGGEETRH